MFQPIKCKDFYVALSTSSTTTSDEDPTNHGRGPADVKTPRDGALNLTPSNFKQRECVSSDPESYTKTAVGPSGQPIEIIHLNTKTSHSSFNILVDAFNTGFQSTLASSEALPKVQNQF